MNTSRELTHPSWRRAPESDGAQRESLMSQMVRAQLIFDRRTPPGGLPVWRDLDGDGSPVRLDTRVGTGIADFLVKPDPAALPPELAEPEAPRFADELAERLQLARDRVEAEHVHLTHVETVADAYLGRPNLRLVK